MTTTALAPSAQLGRNIRAEMVRRGISQEALARRLQMSQASVSKRLRGDVEIGINEVVLIAGHLGVTVDTLLDGIAA